jgi:hypothetical protein
MSELDVVSQDPVILEFPQFSRLPPELRFLIWEKAMEDPRIIHIASWIARSLKAPPDKLKIGRIQFEQVPKFFFVNRECRWVAMTYYPIVKVPIQSPQGPMTGEMLNIHLKKNDIVAFHPLRNSYMTPTNFPYHPRTVPTVHLQSYMFVTTLKSLRKKKNIKRFASDLRMGDIEEYVEHRILPQVDDYPILSWSVVLRNEEDPKYFTLDDLTSLPGDPDLVSKDYPWDIDLFKLRGSNITYRTKVKAQRL